VTIENTQQNLKCLFLYFGGWVDGNKPWLAKPDTTGKPMIPQIYGW
jgi:hypothetical protein